MRKYRGTVEPHDDINDVVQADENTKIALDIMKDYWAFGYDEEVGRDTYLSDPDAAKDAAISRIHLRPVNFTGTERAEFGKTATKACWDEWKDSEIVPGRDASSLKIPTSNDWVVYCVDHQRNVCVLAYLPKPTDPHKLCRDTDVMNNFIAMANKWYETNCSFPMDAEELPLAFDDKWLLDEVA